MDSPSAPLTTRAPHDTIAYYLGRPVTVRELLALSCKIAAELPAGAAIVNLCGNRFHFLAYFCATLLSGGRSILPPNKQPETIAALVNRYDGNLKVIVDAELALPDFLASSTCYVEELKMESSADTIATPRLAINAPCVEVFTSGSTGEPKKLTKTWGILSGTALKLCERLATPANEPCSLIATVPCQHMYGLETSILMPLLGNYSCYDETPFYPNDIVRMLAAAENSVRLVTTPVHLRTVINSKQNLPPQLQQILSATAPLSDELAQQAEQGSGAQVFEIFGFSEAGSIATRRTLAGPQWHLLPGFTLLPGTPVTLQGDHLPHQEVFSDNVEVLDTSHFCFLARSGDHMNIGGKRMSLNDLLVKLLAVEGVEDAHLYTPQREDGRPTGFVVTSRSVREVLADLARVVDPVFLPRPLKKLSRIARNATGKVTQTELHAMLEQARS